MLVRTVILASVADHVTIAFFLCLIYLGLGILLIRYITGKRKK